MIVEFAYTIDANNLILDYNSFSVFPKTEPKHIVAALDNARLQREIRRKTHGQRGQVKILFLQNRFRILETKKRK